MRLKTKLFPCSVHEEIRGSYYTFNMQAGGKKFILSLALAVPLHRLNGECNVNTIGVRRIVQIQVHQIREDGRLKEIWLTEAEYVLLQPRLVELAKTKMEKPDYLIHPLLEVPIRKFRMPKQGAN
jgi:hypothetical protein